MAKNFYECAKNGGRVVSKKDKNGEKIKICYDENNNSHVKKKIKKKKKKESFNDKPTEDSLKKLIEHFNFNY